MMRVGLVRVDAERKPAEIKSSLGTVTLDKALLRAERRQGEGIRMKKRCGEKYKDGMKKLSYRFLYQYLTNILLRV